MTVGTAQTIEEKLYRETVKSIVNEYLNDLYDRVDRLEVESTMTDGGKIAATDAIPANVSAFYGITIGGAETNTIAAPATAGLTIIFNVDVDTSGTRTITFSGGDFDQSGNDKIAFDTVLQYAIFTSFDIDGAGTLAWRLVANGGGTLS